MELADIVMLKAISSMGHPDGIKPKTSVSNYSDEINSESGP